MAGPVLRELTIRQLRALAAVQNIGPGYQQRRNNFTSRNPR